MKTVIRGIGFDLCEIARMEKQAENERFLSRFFTDQEADFIRSGGTRLNTPTIEQRVEHYWTQRARDFNTVRQNELRDEIISRRWLEEMTARFPERQALDILDAGTGTGYFAILLAKAGHRVTGIDLTPAMLAEAEADARMAGGGAPRCVVRRRRDPKPHLDAARPGEGLSRMASPAAARRCAAELRRGLRRERPQPQPAE